MGEDMPPRRVRTQSEMDAEGFAAKKAREALGTPTVEVSGEITGKYEGDELQEHRRRRDTGERVDRLEVKHDDTIKAIGMLAGEIKEVRGEMKVIPELVAVLKDVIKSKSQNETVTLTAQVDVTKQQVAGNIAAQQTKLSWITSLIAILATVATGILAIAKIRGC